MTISVQSNKNIYTGDGNNKTFPYTFKIYQDEDLTVTTEIGGISNSYTLNVDYTVTGALELTGGNVVFTTAPTDGHSVIITGTYDYLQLVNYEDGDAFPADVNELNFDKHISLLIKHSEILERGLRFGDTYTSGNIKMDAPLANAYLHWSSTGARLESTILTTIVTFENLDANGDVGTGANQVAQGNHLHDDRYYTETEVDALITTISGQLDDHDEMNNLDYASAGHTGFQPSGDYATNANVATVSGVLSSEIDSDISTHSASADHDGRYYTETEVDALITTISGKLDDHDEMNNLDYASAGHTGFQPAGDYATNTALTNTSGTLQSEIDALDYYTTAEVDTISGSLNTTIDALTTITDYGNTVLVSGTTSQFVSFGSSVSGTYYPTYTIQNTTDSPPTFYNYITTGTTTSGFTITFSAAIDSSNFSVDWSVVV